MTLFNPIISGVSVSGDLDTASTTLKIEMGNSDKIGHVNMTLQNSTGQYSRILTSGNASMEVDVVQYGNATTLWKGTTETCVPEVDLKGGKGSIATLDGYDYGQELMGVMSPDTRPPYLIWTPTSGLQSGTTMLSVTSGDGGLNVTGGMDLVLYTSGAGNAFSGVVTITVAQFMSQWFGVSGDHTGSMSGQLFTFKPYVPGYTWKTYYTPDASGGVAANDNNNNYFLVQDKLKAKREYAWDTLRKITRQQVVVDGVGNPAPYEMFVDTVGAIHLYTSGSYQLVASGVSLVYYQAGQSGAQNNNIVTAKVPFDLTQVKNVIEGWFPDWTTYPYDGNLWTGFVAYSGAYWSGSAVTVFSGPITLSGGPPAQGGLIAVQGTGNTGTATGNAELLFNFTLFSGTAVNINQWNIVSSGLGIVGNSINISFDLFSSNTGAITGAPTCILGLYDTSGNSIVTKNSVTLQSSGWSPFNYVIYTSGGSFNSGAWTYTPVAGGSTLYFLTGNIKQMRFAPTWPFSVAGTATFAVDNIQFSFDYPFSPITAFNSGSQGMYGRRYANIEWPYQVSAGAASGIIAAQINNRLGPQGVAEFTIKDNPNLPFSAQLGINTGQVFIVDSPYFNTGSGQFFYYWRATSVEHNWDKSQNGFETIIKATPWYSGVIVSPLTNSVNCVQPVLYSATPIAQPDIETYMPFGRSWTIGGH